VIKTVAGLGAAALVAVVVVLALREGTETRHVAVPPDSHVDVTATASLRGAKHRTPELTHALASVCVVESVPTSTMRNFESSDDEFTFQVVPAADEPDRRQLRGCLQDFRIPGVLATVDEMEVVGVD